MNTILKVVVIVVLAIVFIIFKSSKNATAPSSGGARLNERPTVLVPNDKIIVITGGTYDDAKKALTNFCKLYNQKKLIAMPRLTKISESEFAVTLPYDIVDFERYAYLVNYLQYPEGVTWHPHITAWTTARSGDSWIPAKFAGKKLMIYLSSTDTEYDNVILTTEDGVGYKMGFSMGDKKIIESPERAYTAPTIDIESLATKPFEDIQ